ncbi:glucuronate isomerase [Bradyrhizobium sp. Bra64]|uniref:glucuronate isomerase n=1 Tax=Bradyrhizobium sp. Bra64 TaxID=2926009 RepID=UPI002117C29E|nr:glucuronate isomerase [Bradyrhizobium sp. Bra64]
MAGDSHTGFNSVAFTAGALTGAGLLAGALVSGMQAVVQANRAACERWTHDELKTAFNLSELLRYKKCEELAEAKAENAELQAENAKLRLLLRSATVRRAAPSR